MSDYYGDAFAALPDGVTEIFGEEATAEKAYELLTVDVPVGSWIAALEIARDKLGCTFFDWLSAVDEAGTGFRVCAHVASVAQGGVRRLLLRTTVPHAAASLPSAVAVYAGAEWHERETYEMFGITFTDHPHLVHLLLPENFEGHPLRKDFVLAARVAKAWPGAKEPGESHDPNAPKRRQMLPPGVPDPNEWGPLKGQLPPAPARPARAAAGDRPVRRTRTATAGSTSQAPEAPAAAPAAGEGVGPRRARTAAEGSASQGPEAPGGASAAGPRRARTAAEGSASQTPQAPAAAEPPPAGPRRNRTASAGSASQREEPQPPTDTPRAAPRTRSADAPWHHARPAFTEDAATGDTPKPAESAPGTTDPASAAQPAAPESEPGSGDSPAPPRPPAAGEGPAPADPAAGEGSDPTPTDPAGGDPA
ncbi:NADH-quinone oxidoreductase subunit C [Streptomyces sp. NPDC090025]|uniref:NADH-quinone oxidoreductase subunit C n=1 Tax=Streptomyces sp. NPDC090025 TaxID=3365922 RepID=UPI003832C189